jgi:hypothetical protein
MAKLSKTGGERNLSSKIELKSEDQDASSALKSLFALETGTLWEI